MLSTTFKQTVVPFVLALFGAGLAVALSTASLFSSHAAGMPNGVAWKVFFLLLALCTLAPVWLMAMHLRDLWVHRSSTEPQIEDGAIDWPL